MITKSFMTIQIPINLLASSWAIKGQFTSLTNMKLVYKYLFGLSLVCKIFQIHNAKNNSAKWPFVREYQTQNSIMQMRILCADSDWVYWFAFVYASITPSAHIQFCSAMNFRSVVDFSEKQIKSNNKTKTRLHIKRVQVKNSQRLYALFSPYW